MRFSIRDLLLVMVIVGLAAGWWLDRQQLVAANQAVQEQNRLLTERADNAAARAEEAWQRLNSPFHDRYHRDMFGP